MSKDEKLSLEALAQKFAMLPDTKKEYFLGYAEGRAEALEELQKEEQAG